MIERSGSTTLDPTKKYSWTVATGVGAASVTNGETYDLTQAPTYKALVDAGTHYFTLTAGGGNLYLTFLPVPEPATGLAAVAAALGLAGLARWRRPKAA